MDLASRFVPMSRAPTAPGPINTQSSRFQAQLSARPAPVVPVPMAAPMTQGSQFAPASNQIKGPATCNPSLQTGPMVPGLQSSPEPGQLPHIVSSHIPKMQEPNSPQHQDAPRLQFGTHNLKFQTSTNRAKIHTHSYSASFPQLQVSIYRPRC